MRKVLNKMMSAAAVAMLVLGLLVPVSGLMMVEDTYAVAVPNMPIDGGGGGGGNKEPEKSDYVPVNAGTSSVEVETSILPSNWGIENILKLILNVLVYGLGAAATLGVIIAGIMYMTARDNESQVAKAKTRLYEVVIGLVAWALMYAVLQWLLPGGLNF